MSKKHQHSIFSMCKSIGFFCAFVLLLCSIIFWRCSPVPEPQPKEETDTIVIDTIQDTIPADTIPTDTIPIHPVDTEDCCPTGPFLFPSVVLIKFADESQIANVIVCKQLQKNYGSYWENTTLTNTILTDDFDFYGMDSLDVILDYDIFNKYLKLAHSSPYIELTDGYYMINWRWMEIFPTHLYNIKPLEAFTNEMNVLPTKWIEFDNIFNKYDKSTPFNPIEIEDIRWYEYASLDNYRGEETPLIGAQDGNKYIGWGISAYWAMQTYNLKGEKALENFVWQADSIYNIYKETLIEAMTKGEEYLLYFDY